MCCLGVRQKSWEMGAPTRSPLSQRQRGSKNRRRPRRLCLSTAVSGPLARGARRTAADPACLTQRRRLGRAENRAGSFDSARPEGPSPSAQDGRSGQLAPLRMTERRRAGTTEGGFAITVTPRRGARRTPACTAWSGCYRSWISRSFRGRLRGFPRGSPRVPAMSGQHCVYIMSSKSGVLYIGSTSDLERRNSFSGTLSAPGI